jgi:N-acetylmuramoyl-L-alanine amidase
LKTRRCYLAAPYVFYSDCLFHDLNVDVPTMKPITTFFALLTLLVTAYAAPCLAQTELQLLVQLENGGTYTEKIPLYALNNQSVIAPQDLCAALKLYAAAKEKSLKVSALSRQKVLMESELRAQNHFMAVRDAAANRAVAVAQFSGAPIYYGTKLYLTPKDAALFIGRTADAKTFYNPDESSLSVSFAEAFSDAAGDSVRISAIPRFTFPSLTVEEKANGIMMRLVSTKSKVPYEFVPPDKNGIAYLTFVGATGDMKSLTYLNKEGFLKRITPLRMKSGALQLTLEFNAQKFPVKSSEFVREQGTSNFIMLVGRDADVKKILEREQKENATQKVLQQERKKWKLDVIALDAGHGGKDPGAIGATGKYEKDAALAIVKKVGKLIEESWDGVKVVYTRNTDKFVELDERGKIANKANAKLFVSFHCNASVNKKADGAEVYFLGKHKNDAALTVAQRENAVITEEQNAAEKYKDFTEENLIMITMAQSGFVQESQKLAELINHNLEAHAKRQTNGVKQAGFMVLWTPSMPSILIEMGFITNAAEEKVLHSDDGQTKIAEAIFKSLTKYRDDYEAETETASDE